MQMGRGMDLEAQVHSQLALHNSKDLLRFITCGNVDDGKSTLIGRLLLEAGAIYDDQIEVLQHESTKFGTTGGRLDTALLLDGLEDERQQGITIDVAYRYFTTQRRKFILADSPGHEQFTRNMATAASTADLAIVSIDVTKGVSVQTRRHAFIASLLGVKHLVLAINKMDLVQYSQAIFQQIVDDFSEFSRHLDLADVYAIPLSALEGDNVTQKSQNMAWYQGQTLLGHLDHVRIEDQSIHAPMRFPIQRVSRPDASFRGFSGTLCSGSLRCGEEVLVLPMGNRARVKSMLTMDGEMEQAVTHDAMTITLDRELNLARGDMLVHCNAAPRVTTELQATLIWMSEQPLILGKRYWLKQTTRKTPCEVKSLHFRTDVNSLVRVSAPILRLNEIGFCSVKTTEPLMVDDYRANRGTGSFILADRITHETVAAGLIGVGAGLAGEGNWTTAAHVDQPQQRRSLVGDLDRARRYGQQPGTVLITGLSSSGKTTIALLLEKLLFEAGKTVVVLDGQWLRMGISRDLTFSAEERSENLRRGAEIAKLLNDSGQICIAAFVAPSAWVRQKAKELIGSQKFLHIHLKTQVEICRERDRSGQYAAADRGDISNFPGVSYLYEVPDDADLYFDTSEHHAEHIANAVYAWIQNNWIKETV